MIRAVQTLIVLFALSLTGCGTNIVALLEDDSQLAWEAEEAIQMAEDRNIASTNGYYDAETEKLQFCRPLYRKAEAQIDLGLRGGGASIFDRFWGDLMLLGALLLPVPEIEECARAIKRYEAEYSALSDRIGS